MTPDKHLKLQAKHDPATAGAGAARLLAVLLLALGLALPGAPLLADEDHDDATRLRRSGEILPLQEVLKRSQRGRKRVLDVELGRKRNGYVYEVESLDKKGRVRKDYYDAKTGKRMRSKHKD